MKHDSRSVMELCSSLYCSCRLAQRTISSFFLEILLLYFSLHPLVIHGGHTPVSLGCSDLAASARGSESAQTGKPSYHCK